MPAARSTVKLAETYNRKAEELSLLGFCFTRRKSLPYLLGRWTRARAAGGVPKVCGSYRRCANFKHPSVACYAGATSPARQGRL